MRRTKLPRKPRALQFGDLRAELPQRVGDVADMVRTIVAEMNEDDRECRPDLCKMAQSLQIAPFRAEGALVTGACGVRYRSPKRSVAVTEQDSFAHGAG
ncbi:hypothetical protein [Burkholderia sp. Nafp2/4-1b]|uniref:hypothetical protein n=1 Tax=Burkholderia sp. Nafp2/4-1b TaxID=2116686 RepID=UPI001F088E4E|nr:hypothetical protein [Burkholderia sp. Nafp2/4-1b]